MFEKITYMRIIATLLLSFALISGTAASAKIQLRDVSEIDNAMLWVALAIEISDKCDEIEPRALKGLSVLYGLKRLGCASAARSM